MKLKGRILRHEAGHLHAHYQAIKREEFNAIEPCVRQQVFEIVKAWAEPRFPAIDLETLRRYDLVDDVIVINATAWNPETKRWDLRYGLQFPENQSIPMPMKSRFGGGTYRSVYVGGLRLEADQDQIDELKPFCEQIEVRRRVYASELAEFNAFVKKLPLRRDVAEQYPDVAKQMLSWQLIDAA